LVSAYYFLCKGGMYKADAVWAEKNIKKYEGFDDFINNWVNDENIHSFTHFNPQYKYITDRNGIIRADFVGKTENIEKDFKIVSSRLGMESNLLHMNKTSHDSYVDYYDDKSKLIVAKFYEKDINLFGYEFGR